MPPDWLWVAFTSGSTEPTADGDGTAVIWGDTSNANAVLEYLRLTSGTWGGGDAAGYMLLSNWNGVAWTSGENFTADTSTPGNHGTLTSVPVSAAATKDIRQGTATNTNLLDFDATTNELAVFPFLMPNNYDGGGITVTVGVTASTATTGDMSWAIFPKSVSDDVDDLDVKNFGSPNFNTSVTTASASGKVKYFDIAFTDGSDMDNIAAGELFFLMLMRDAQDATNDDMSGDGEFVFLAIKET